ncbi:MAG: hypothetical protein FWH48_09435, partial [Oscillospiraceae bacterium]|nr:hypothetical protein [Oscillospiraceae bacterium]
MKKVLAFILTIVLVSAILAPAMFANADDAKSTDAIKGTPSMMDAAGSTDPIWQYANMFVADIQTTNIFPTETPAWANVWAMWDENYLYVLADIYKTPAYYEGFVNEEADTIEYGIDFLNTKETGNIQSGIPSTGVFRINAVTGEVTGFGGAFDAVGANAKGAWVETDFGYKSQVAIPWSDFVPGEGKTISMEVQINVNGEGTGRDGLVTWNYPECMGWGDSSSHGEVNLVAAPVIAEPEPEPEP